MSINYIPNADSDFLTWATNFSSYLTLHAGELPIDAEQITAINGDVNGFRSLLNGYVTNRDAAHAACQLKDERRTGAEDLIRTVVRQFQASPDVTDAQREGMGIPVHSEGRCLKALALPTRPIGSIDTAERLLHKIRYWDELTPNKRAKPDHTMGCEIWHILTAPGEAAPLDTTGYKSLGINTASPFIAEYGGADVGKMAHYLLRWISTTGETGPWSEILSAVVVG